MTTTDSGWTPPPPAAPFHRVIRRSRTERVGAGVAGGLGEYFGVDPVLFRVLFATSAFFGGAGILAYLLAWAAIPEAGTSHAAIDRWVSSLRRRRVPFWTVAVVASIGLWAVAFSWWAPGPFLPVIVVTLVLIAVLAHNERRPKAAPDAPDTDGSSAGPTVNLLKDGDAAAPTDPNSPSWVRDAREWFDESRVAGQLRRRRALPVKLATLGALVITLAVLGVIDATHGLPFRTYFWVTGAITLAGILIGAVLRRAPWSIAALLIPALAGQIAFAGSHASLHDGSGNKEWTPTTTVAAQYRLAFGQGVLDLRQLPTPVLAHTVDITAGAGQVKVLLPAGLNATVNAKVHIGQIEVDGNTVVTTRGGSFHRIGGYDVNHVVLPRTGAHGAPLTINIRLADGNVDVEHRT